MLKKLLLGFIYLYQRYISPMMAPRCRYHPTCSAYGKQALLWHGVRRGLPMLIRRVASCHPWGGSGIDFVPVPLYRLYFVPSNIKPHMVYDEPMFYTDLLNHYLCHHSA